MCFLGSVITAVGWKISRSSSYVSRWVVVFFAFVKSSYFLHKVLAILMKFPGIQNCPKLQINAKKKRWSWLLGLLPLWQVINTVKIMYYEIWCFFKRKFSSAEYFWPSVSLVTCFFNFAFMFSFSCSKQTFSTEPVLSFDYLSYLNLQSHSWE